MLLIIKSIISAMQFCTSIPLPVKTDLADLKRGIAYFPIAGVITGLICGLIFKYTVMIWNQSAASILTIFAYLILTRALHMDGFMDTIDGFFSGKPRKQILSIMKDPTVGSFAVCGALCWFGWMFAFLPLILWHQLILIFCISRWGIIWLGLISSYPRESGTGKFFIESVTKSMLLPGLFINIGLGIWLGWLNLILIIFILFYGWLVSIWSEKKIAGITGDVLGFFIESSTLLSLLILSLINKI